MLGCTPDLLSGNWIEFVVTSSELRSVSSLAPAERKPQAAGSKPRKSGGKKSVIDRAQAYVDKMPGAVAGEEGHKQTFAVACALILGFELPFDQARPIFADYNLRCQPLWSDAELDHKLADAEKADGERGYLIKETLRSSIESKHENEFEPFEFIAVPDPVGVELPEIDLPSLEIHPFGSQPETAEESKVEPEQSKPAVNPVPGPVRQFPIRNFDELQASDGTVKIPLPINVIADRILRQTDNWPRRTGNELFAPDVSGDGVNWIRNSDSLFAFLGSKSGFPPEFVGGKTLHTHGRPEVYEHLRVVSQNYSAVENIPHEPKLAGHFYACRFPKLGDGSTLNELVDRFNPETPIDRDLVLAAFVTPFWGGHGGTRPAFCITSPDGRGSGKSRLAFMVSDLAAGHVEISNGEDFQTTKTRLLSSDGCSKRIALLDNVKSLKFSWAELESLITSPTISGKKLYVGEGSRPNTLTFFITLNGPSLSTDLAQRCVFISIKKPIYSPTWEEETRAFIANNRQALIGDVMAFLRSEKSPLARFSRWGDWEREILSRLPEPSEAQQVIAERQSSSDVESEESDLVEEHFAKMLSDIGYRPKNDKVFIPVAIAAKWFSEAMGDRYTTSKASRSIRQKIDEGQIKLLFECLSRSNGRGFEWCGPEADFSSVSLKDIEYKIETSRRNTFEY